MQVRDLMSTAVVTVPADATLEAVADRLLDAEVGSVVVVDSDGNPMGIVTESDVLRAARDTGRPLADIAISEVTHRPVVTTTPSRAISTVARQMTDEGVKKVPVLDGIDLVGIVTMTDIVWELPALWQEAGEIRALRDEWSPN